jgi:pyridoxine/pyridoxamine 5'-phosphate oxidase
MSPPDVAERAAADPAAAARSVIDAATYMTLATADPQGRPWATPVWFSHLDYREFVWVSRPGTRHSTNLAARPELAIAIFDSRVRVGEAEAVYIEAAAGELSEQDLEEALETFNRRSEEQSLPLWSAAKVSGSGEFRLYRAVATQLFVLGPHDQRIAV